MHVHRHTFNVNTKSPCHPQVANEEFKEIVEIKKLPQLYIDL